MHRNAGVIASNMQLAEVTLRFRQSVEDRLFLCHIDPHRHHALVGAGQAVRRLLDRFLLDIGHDHVGTGLGQSGRDAKPDPGRRASDDRGLA